MIPDPQGRGFFVVKVDKIMPGNALLQPALIGQMQNELQRATVGRLCARSSSPPCAPDLKVKRNDGAIQALKTRMLTQRRLSLDAGA